MVSLGASHPRSTAFRLRRVKLHVAEVVLALAYWLRSDLTAEHRQKTQAFLLCALRRARAVSRFAAQNAARARTS